MPNFSITRWCFSTLYGRPLILSIISPILCSTLKFFFLSAKKKSQAVKTSPNSETFLTNRTNCFSILVEVFNELCCYFQLLLSLRVLLFHNNLFCLNSFGLFIKNTFLNKKCITNLSKSIINFRDYSFGANQYFPRFLQFKNFLCLFIPTLIRFISSKRTLSTNSA